MVANNAPVERNVEAQLLNTKVLRRRPGDVPYPVHHSDSVSAFDIWDNMFIRTSCHSLTVHQFETPPAVVLDLGCGNGYWAIEAAKEWKMSSIVGYDFRRTQPNLFKLEQYRNIAHRVNWVHGNLLDGLPFSSSQFDLVRIVNIGLGVPEDEWQFVFEEVARVMKSGAVIELLEEDPIFPYAQPAALFPQEFRSRPRPSPISVDLPPFEPSLSSAISSRSSATLMSDPWSAALDERFQLTASKSKPKVTRSLKSGSPQSQNSPILSKHSTAVHSLPPVPPVLKVDLDKMPDPRDHSKLKAAWDAMLSARFISTSLLAIIPFYLSTIFIDVRSFPPLKVRLPPNSGPENTPPLPPNLRRSADSGIAESVYQGSIYTKYTCKSDRSSTSSGEGVCSASSIWPTMHLAKTVNTVTACKEAIWEQYQKIHAGDKTPLVIHPLAIRTNGPDRVTGERSKTSIREAFDAEWSSWQNDMADRIGMRSSITAQLGWSEPPGDRPDWRVWRSNVAKAQLNHENSPWSETSPWPGLGTENVDLCRSTRAWVAWKR